jgi:glycosyltransferase involved in cell wall biosynthesis
MASRTLISRRVDTSLFHPVKRSLEMRFRLTGGRLDRPVALYVGRLSVEKNLELLAGISDAIPGLRLALVGDGPARAKLERRFSGRPVQFLGFLRGEELAAAFASADLFVVLDRDIGFVVLNRAPASRQRRRRPGSGERRRERAALRPRGLAAATTVAGPRASGPTP